MSALETISAEVFNILYSAWKLFQPKCLVFIFDMETTEARKILFWLLPVSEEVGLGP